MTVTSRAMSIFALTCSLLLSGVISAQLYEEYTYEQFVETYRPRKTAEVLNLEQHFKRAQIFNENMKLIREQNIAYLNGRSKWFAEVNRFADWTEEEMAARFGYDKIAARATRQSRPIVDDAQLEAWAKIDLPEQLDWRKKGVVTPPKNQGGCGSCWAFSGTETVESAVAMATGKLLTLAPQNFVSCLENPNQCGGTGGCEGATAELAFGYTAQHGLALESDYPYEGEDSKCKADVKPAVYVNHSVSIPNNNAQALMQAVATQGPVSISVAAKSWSFYSGGVFDGALGLKCDVDVDHAVQLVGYGTTSDKTAYWLVRNSWGASWGEDGYIRLLRSPGNEPCAMDTTPTDGNCGISGPCKCPSEVKYCGTCAVLSDSSYPVGARLA